MFIATNILLSAQKQIPCIGYFYKKPGRCRVLLKYREVLSLFERKTKAIFLIFAAKCAGS